MRAIIRSSAFPLRILERPGGMEAGAADVEPKQDSGGAMEGSRSTQGEERFLSTQADPFTGVKGGRKSRPAPFEMTVMGIRDRKRYLPPQW